MTFSTLRLLVLVWECPARKHGQAEQSSVQSPRSGPVSLFDVSEPIKFVSDPLVSSMDVRTGTCVPDVVAENAFPRSLGSSKCKPDEY